MMKFSLIHKLCWLSCCLLIGAGWPAVLPAKHLPSTSYKTYTVFTYKNEKILCEPYRVKKGECLFNILKVKGEIANRDFPFFFEIFKKLNKRVKNIDLIYADSIIVIPLAKVAPNAYQTDAKGNFQIPVLEFSPRKTRMTQISASPPPPPEAYQAPTSAPSNSKKKWDELKKYITQYGGKLNQKGKVHFPPIPGKKGLALNLSQHPIFTTKEGQKFLLLSNQASVLSPWQINHIKSYWPNVKITHINDLFRRPKRISPLKKQQNTFTEKYLPAILSETQTPWTPNEKISISLDGFSMEIKLPRIQRKQAPDLLINNGIIYGNKAIQTIKDMGFEIFTIPIKAKQKKRITTLLEYLGYTVYQNPSFPIIENKTEENEIREMNGLLAKKQREKLFFSLRPLDQGAEHFLKKNNIKHCLLR